MDKTNTDTSIEQLNTLTTAIEQALADNKPVKFSRLVKKHTRYINNILNSNNGNALSNSQLQNLADKYQAWISRARIVLNDKKNKIEEVQYLRNTRKKISSAYSKSPGGTGNFISRKG
jgi:hypothetical protein